jgi:hypothetical protein
MEDGLKTYLQKQLRVIVDKGDLDNSDMDPTAGSSLSIERIKTCKTTRECTDYMADDLRIGWPLISQAYLVNFCCEICNFYKPREENSQ